MLVLSRRSHESIRIGDTIVVTVLEVRGDHVRIGIDAPNDVEVHRQEVYDSIQAANVSAASPAPAAVAAAADAVRRMMGNEGGASGGPTKGGAGRSAKPRRDTPRSGSPAPGRATPKITPDDEADAEA